MKINHLAKTLVLISCFGGFISSDSNAKAESAGPDHLRSQTQFPNDFLITKTFADGEAFAGGEGFAGGETFDFGDAEAFGFDVAGATSAPPENCQDHSRSAETQTDLQSEFEDDLSDRYFASLIDLRYSAEEPQSDKLLQLSDIDINTDLQAADAYTFDLATASLPLFAMELDTPENFFFSSTAADQVDLSSPTPDGASQLSSNMVSAVPDQSPFIVFAGGISLLLIRRLRAIV